MGTTSVEKSQSSGVPEFRIFKSLKVDNLEQYNSLHLYPYLKKYGKVEDRIDFYIFPISLEFSQLINYGLKFRDVKITDEKNYKGKKLELKIRHSHSEGIEDWEKTISTNAGENKLLSFVPNQHTSQEGYFVKILDKLYEVQIENIRSIVSSKLKLYYKDSVLINSLSLPLAFGITYKKRINWGQEDALIHLESFKFSDKVSEPVKSKSSFFRSYCIEGGIDNTSLSSIKSLADNSDLICGYPEAIILTII